MSAIGAAVVAVLTAVTIAVSAKAGLLVERHRVAAAADAAVLAAADAASGLSPGVPCDVARSVAAADEGRLDACVVDGSTTTVVVASTDASVPIRVTATAGRAGYADSGSIADPKK